MSRTLYERFGPEAVARMAQMRPRSFGMTIVMPSPQTIAARQARSSRPLGVLKAANHSSGNIARSSGLPGQDRAGKVEEGEDGQAVVTKQAERGSPQGMPGLRY